MWGKGIAAFLASVCSVFLQDKSPAALAFVAAVAAALESSALPAGLSAREMEVLALIVTGMTNRQIAQRLTISEKTAEGHVGNILAKLSCSSRIKAAELARATGLLEGSAA